MKHLFGRQAFVELLLSEGITHLFGNPGTTELPIMQALPDYPDLRFVLGLQESVVVAMADGFARASRQLTAANVHVAPGLGNAMGALYNAKFSGSPLILTAGQQEQGHGLLEPLLYDPLPSLAAPLVKWSVEVTQATKAWPQVRFLAARGDSGEGLEAATGGSLRIVMSSSHQASGRRRCSCRCPAGRSDPWP